MPGMFAVADSIPALPPQHGLRSAAQEVQTPDRWDLGITSPAAETCIQGATFDPSCLAIQPDVNGVKAPPFIDPIRPGTPWDTDPFALESGFECDAQGLKMIDFPGRARRQLEAVTSKLMEFELWTGEQKPGNPSLDKDAVVLAGGVAQAPLRALIHLGSALSSCGSGGPGMLHAPTWLVDLWIGLYGALVVEQGARLTTKVRKDIIVAGTGYPGTGPDGATVAAGRTWVYATGQVQYRLGEILVFPETVKEATNRGTNDVEYTAMRMAMVNFDPCCHFAVLVDETVT